MNARKKALTSIAARECGYNAEIKPYRVGEEYGIDAFGLKTLEDYVSKPIYKKLLDTIRQGVPLDPAVADDVAHAMKIWAMSRGATHYTHWFLPLTGASARKARRVPRTRQGRRRNHEVLRQKPYTRRARRFVFSRPAACARHSRRAATRRGTRLRLRS